MMTEVTKTKWIVTPGVTGPSQSAPSVTVNGSGFFACGVCYQPVPWGGSANWPPFGDFMSSPWHEVWERDLPVMRAGGVNLLRTYNMQCEQQGVEHQHANFLEACWNGGVDPIYVLLGIGDLNNLAIYHPWDASKDGRSKAEEVFLNTVTKYKDSPAVMGFIVANEVNTTDTTHDAKFWSWLNCLCHQAKKIAPDKITVMSLVDDSMESVQAGDSHMPDLDVWGINSYRGQISPANANNFNNLWSSFQTASQKPLLITEWGAPASTHDSSGNLSFSATVANDLNTYITGHYQDIQFNAVSTTSSGSSSNPPNPNSANWAQVCIGSCYFEWSDELWKLDAASGIQCQATVQNPGISTNAAFPGRWDDEECFGLNSITPVESGGVQPIDRPGPTSTACTGGPWNFASNEPYPADVLTPRPSWTLLSSMFTSGTFTSAVLGGTIVNVSGESGSWQATFYLGEPVPGNVVPNMAVYGPGVPVGTTVASLPPPPNTTPLLVVIENPSTATTNPFTASQNGVNWLFYA